MLIETQSISTLRRRAKLLGLLIRKDRLSGLYYLIDMKFNAVFDGPMDLEAMDDRLSFEEANQ